MSDLNRIKEKLAKLLRLGEDNAATPGEIQNALNAASLLMARHQLTRDDIDTAALDPTAKVSLGRHFAFCKGANLTIWEGILTTFVCEFIGPVQCYTSKNQPVRRNGIADLLGNSGVEEVRTATAIVFYGADEDARCASELFEELRDAVATMAIVRWGTWARGDGASYAYGFASSLQQANQTSRRALHHTDAETTALMLRAEQNSLAIIDKATSWLATTHNIRLAKRTGPRRLTITSNAALTEGRRDGANYSVTRPGQQPRID